MKEGFEPKSFKNYNLTPEEQKELDKLLNENLEKGYIRLSQSPQASPFFFVKKKDGRLRPCQDYWYLNDWTIKNAYPLPLILEIMDKLKKAKYFSKFDVQWGYNNIRIQSGDEWKAAFKTNRGLYEPTVMFFGMCNSPATFQAMMDKIFKKEIEENLIIVYMDDILAFSKTIDGLKKIEQIILEKAWEYDLYFKAKKCEFRNPKIEYLGLVVEEGKLAMDPAKLKGILDWPAPKTVKEVQSFIGFGNFYHRFVKKFSHLAHPLHDLLKKDKKFVWSEECQESFDQLKKWFTEEPVLMMPNHSEPFQIQVDSLLFATGGILTQMDTNGDRHPCAYLSKSLMKEQRNYDTRDRELLAIVQALKEWRHYIQGFGHTTIVLSDHDNLRHFKVPQTIGRQMVQWTLYLSEFDIKLVHIPGKKNIQADSLLRRPDLCPQRTDNEDVIVLPEHLFVNLIDMELQKKIANAKNMDYDAAEAIKELLEQRPREAKKDLMDWEVEEFEGENILFYKGKNYVPINAELWREIVRRYHDHLTAGHPGELQTFNVVKEHYWWPGLRVFIKNYVQGCGTCQQFKIDRNPSKPAFVPIKGAKSTWPFASCSMDLITDLPPINDCDSILVVVDRGTQRGQFSFQWQKLWHKKGQDNFFWTTSTNNLVYLTKCCLIEDQNLLKKPFANCWNS
jgi:RNase H-like domain found in reverse transcriptase/Reverse transcriptase (RNA-dependent DNA polymerase)/Integrase zinc binding domain